MKISDVFKKEIERLKRRFNEPLSLIELNSLMLEINRVELLLRCHEASEKD